MNLNELIINIRKVSSEKNVQLFAEIIQNWKINEKNIVELKENAERFLGNTWIDKKENFEKVYELWSNFRDSAINGIGGMTMNERLYCFGLFEQFDKSLKTAEKERIYNKLTAEK